MSKFGVRLSRIPGGFTLIELLVVMGVVGVLAVLTLMSMRAIANDARLASAKNTVKAALDTARAQAMKNNTIVLLVFRPRLEGVHKQKQEVDIYIAKWTGESAALDLDGDGDLDPVDRFVPIPALAVRSIPAGIKVAAPFYGGDQDEDWITQSHLPSIDQLIGSGEAPGGLIAIMYGPDGTTLTRNSQSDSDRIFVDFNNDGLQHDDSNDYGYTGAGDAPDLFYFEQTFEADEPFVSMAPFLAVFDDDEAREIFDAAAWGNASIRLADLTDYITQFADRIHFNRYTGVVMK